MTKETEPRLIEDISQFELKLLGLDKDPIYLKNGQVNVIFHALEDGSQQASIFINDVEITALDPISGQYLYKVTGYNRYAQPWSTGGAYLGPLSDQKPYKEEKA